jgi:hypothetical protein
VTPAAQQASKPSTKARAGAAADPPPVSIRALRGSSSRVAVPVRASAETTTSSLRCAAGRNSAEGGSPRRTGASRGWLSSEIVWPLNDASTTRQPSACPERSASSSGADAVESSLQIAESTFDFPEPASPTRAQRGPGAKLTSRAERKPRMRTRLSPKELIVRMAFVSASAQAEPARWDGPCPMHE